MTKGKLTETAMMIGLIIVLLFLAISLLINSSKSCDVNIKYDVTASYGKNITQFLNPAEIKLACYKLCVEQLKYDDSMQRICFDKCEALQ